MAGIQATCRWAGGVALSLLVMSVPAVSAAGGDGPPAFVVGSNYEIDFNQELFVPFSGFAGAWFVSENLNHQPQAGPMIKTFESPITDTLDPILLDAQQPFPIAVRETFNMVHSAAASPLEQSRPTYGWYEEILTPGFQWVTPDHPDYISGGVFGTPLITKNGLPHPSRPTISIAGQPGLDDDARPLVYRPDIVNVEFSRIVRGETLGINKAMVWVGTEGNRVWGDDQLDDGTPHREHGIRVWEHPWELIDVFGFERELVGDHNRSGRVGQGDLDLVLANWGRDVEAVGLPRGWFGVPAQGPIDQAELDEVLSHWGDRVFPIPIPLGGASVPEPGSVGVVLAGLLVTGLLRRRCTTVV